MNTNLAVLESGLVPVYTYGEDKEHIANARELYDFLNSDGKMTRFNDWIARKLDKYGFIEGEDFWEIKEESTGGRPPLNFYISLPVAKHICRKEKSIKSAEALSFFVSIDNIEVMVREPKRKEIEFGNLLKNMLKGITEGSQIRTNNFNYNPLKIIEQAKFDNGKYKVDFLIPSFSLIIEYDENYHERQKELDKIRENEINEKYWLLEGCENKEEPCKWIRVKEGKEYDGIREILKELSCQEIGF